MQVAVGVYMVRSPVGGNAWILADEHEITLIDTGTTGTDRHILDSLRSLGRDPKEISHILLTHGHPDHYGGASALQKLSSAQVFIHPQDVSFSRKGVPRLWYHWAPTVTTPRIDGYFEDGQRFPTLGGLQVVHTPGHTPGSVTFYLTERDLVFTGDTLLSNGRFFRRPFPFLPHTRLSDYRRSLLRLAELTFETACPGHGPPILRDGGQRLLEYLQLRYGKGPLWWRTVRQVPGLSRFGARIVTRGKNPSRRY